MDLYWESGDLPTYLPVHSLANYRQNSWKARWTIRLQPELGGRGEGGWQSRQRSKYLEKKKNLSIPPHPHLKLRIRCIRNRGDNTVIFTQALYGVLLKSTSAFLSGDLPTYLPVHSLANYRQNSWKARWTIRLQPELGGRGEGGWQSRQRSKYLEKKRTFQFRHIHTLNYASDVFAIAGTTPLYSHRPYTECF